MLGGTRMCSSRCYLEGMHKNVLTTWRCSGLSRAVQQVWQRSKMAAEPVTIAYLLVYMGWLSGTGAAAESNAKFCHHGMVRLPCVVLAGWVELAMVVACRLLSYSACHTPWWQQKCCTVVVQFTAYETLLVGCVITPCYILRR
jgi:hypothetical protein